MLVTVDTKARLLRFGGTAASCAIGLNGACKAADKREGDGTTPLGRYPLRMLFYRADRWETPPATRLPVRALDPADGWCDAPEDSNYNRLVRHPYPASAEHLWRDDGLYDLITTIGHNDSPPLPGLGSAIFLHCAKYGSDGGMRPTRGCVAIDRKLLYALLAQLGPEPELEIF